MRLVAIRIVITIYCNKCYVNVFFSLKIPYCTVLLFPVMM